MTVSRKYAGRTLDASLDYGRNYGIGTALGYGVTTRRDGTGAILFSADSRFLVGGPYVIGTGGYEFPAARGVLKITATGRYYGGRLDQTDELRTAPDIYRFSERNSYRQGELGLRYERTYGRTTVETQLLERLTGRRLRDETQRPPRPFIFTEADDETETVLRTVLRFKRDDRLTLESSAEGALNTVDTASAQTSNGVSQPLPAPNVGVRERRGDAGVKLTWKPNDRYSLDAALKAEGSVLNASGDVTLQRRFAYLKPRAVFAWSPDKQTQLRLRAEHEVGQVEFNNFVTTSEFFSGQFRAGNPNIRPQRAYVAEAVLERRFWLTGSLSLTLRQQALRDVVDVAPVFSPTGVYGVVTNIGKGKESVLIANVTLPLKRLGLKDTLVRGVVTRAWRSVDDPVDGRPRLLSNRLAVLAELHLTQDLPRRKLSWGFDAFYRSAFTLYRPLGNEAAVGWLRGNVFVEYRPTSSLTLRTEVQNLPGRRIRQTVSVFSGLRDASPLLYRDERDLSVGPLLFLRLRKSFG
jgi:hypothetical protein